MADKNDAKAPDKAPVPEAEATPKKKGLPPVVLYAVIGLVVIGAGFFAGKSFFGSAGNAPATEKKEKPKKTAGGEKEGASTVFKVDNIIVNPSGTGGTRYLSVSMAFEVGSQETMRIFEDKQPLIRDALITILGSKTIEQLSDPRQKEITRFQIKKRIEQLLQLDDLAAVYFTDFIIQ
ncbi:putative Flagellar protein FliL [Candidatus Zixiibacteriota bacterium]|nr:putative Flagellar protein FliL [candidate division Zixibacteria bacterium]